MRQTFIHLIILIMTIVRIGHAYAQIYIPAKVSSVIGETVTIDIGAEYGLVMDLKGTIFYFESIGGKDIRINVALVEITDVDRVSARLKILKKTDEVQTGYNVEIEAATITITGAPANAQVSLDGTILGAAPIRNMIIAPGRHNVSITMSDHDPYEATVDVALSESAELKYELVSHLALFTVEGRPPGASVFIDNKLIGKTPLTPTRLYAGSHKLRIVASGYEVHESDFTVGKGERKNLDPILIPKSKSKVLSKSLILPGSGQRYAEYENKGTLISVLQVITIGGTVGTTLMAMSAQSEYNEALNAYKKASGSIAEIEAAAEKAENKYDTVSNIRTFQTVAAGTAVAVYLWNIIDAAVTTPKTNFTMSGNSLNFSPMIGSNATGMYVSMRF